MRSTRSVRSKSKVRRWGSSLALVACFALASLTPREARAGLADDLAIGLFVFTVVVGADIVFTGYDAVVAANGELPSQGWAIAELVVTAPQSLLLGGLAAGLTFSDSEAETNASLIPFAIWPGALTTHAVWSLVPSRVSPSTLFVAPPGVAANTLLTASAFAALFTPRRVFTRPVGVAEIMLTLPSVVGGSVRLVNDPSHRPGWAAFTAWSGALMLHGVASLLVTDPERGSQGQSLPTPARPYRYAAIAPRIDGFGPAPIAPIALDALDALDVERPPTPGLVLRGAF